MPIMTNTSYMLNVVDRTDLTLPTPAIHVATALETKVPSDRVAAWMSEEEDFVAYLELSSGFCVNKSEPHDAKHFQDGCAKATTKDLPVATKRQLPLLLQRSFRQ